MRALLPAMLVSVFVLGALNAHADEKADAKKHFDAGVVLLNAEDFSGAAAEFEASVGLYPTKNGLFNLANCYKALHKYREALAALDSLEQEFGKSLYGELKTNAETMRKEIGSVICTLKVRAKKPGASVFVDGELVGKSPLPITATLGPGEHEVRVELPGNAPVVQTVKLLSGDTRNLEFALDGTDATTGPPAVGAPVGASPTYSQAPVGAVLPSSVSGNTCATDRECRRPRVCFHGSCVSKVQRYTNEKRASNLLIPGWIFTILGVGSLITGPILYAAADPAIGIIITLTGSISGLGIGLPLTIVGHIKRKRIKDGVAPLEVRNDYGLELAPSFAVLDGGGAIGLNGRF